MLKKCLTKIDPIKAKQMLIGVTGIYLSFLVIGIVYEKITTTQYLNSQTNLTQPFRITCGLILVEKSINYFLGSIYMHFTIPKEQIVNLPHKNSAIVGLLIWLSNITQTQSIYLVSYPLIIMAKSCNLISVILVGVLCSRVRSKGLKLGSKKIVIAVVVSLGIVMFRVFDPMADSNDQKITQIFGLVLLFVSLLADGFVPDFQAEIKDKYQPTSIEMLVTINKWCAIFALLYLIILWQLPTFLSYCFTHLQFTLDMLFLSVLSFIGQLFIYRMIRSFKQHIVPFIVTKRKILTVGLSIVYFRHETNVGQLLSILVVLAVTMYEFLGNVVKGNQKEKGQKTVVELEEEVGTGSVNQTQEVDKKGQMQKE